MLALEHPPTSLHHLFARAELVDPVVGRHALQLGEGGCGPLPALAEAALQEPEYLFGRHRVAHAARPVFGDDGTLRLQRLDSLVDVGGRFPDDLRVL